MAPTSLFGSVVRNPNRSFVVSPSFTFLTEVQLVQSPAKKARGRVSSKANHTGGLLPSGSASFSLKLVNGTTQRCSMPSQRRQCGDLTLRILVTPESALRPFRADTGEGMPHRAVVEVRATIFSCGAIAPLVGRRAKDSCGPRRTSPNWRRHS